MTELSSSTPIVKWSEQWWASAKPEVRARRCKAHKKDGSQCGKAAMNFQKVCGTHGGKAKNSVLAARRRMMENADPAVAQLQKIAFDPNNPLDIRFKATMAIIDRVGLAPRSNIELEITGKAYESIFENLESGSRAAYRGESEPQRALPAGDDEPIDVDIEPDDFDEMNPDVFTRNGQPITPDAGENGSAAHTAPETDQWGSMTPPAEAQMMPLDAAVSVAAEMRRQTAMSRQAMRALPRGRS